LVIFFIVVRGFSSWLVSIVSVFVFLVIVSNDILPERFMALNRLVTGELTSVDVGSIVNRQIQWYYALKVFSDNPFFGIGIGNFFIDAGDYESHYPHNFFLELLAEYGMLGMVLFLLILIPSYIKSDNYYKIIFLFCFISLSFSGDASYWRFFFLFLILGYHFKCFACAGYMIDK